MSCPNGILIKEEIKFDNNHSLVHLRVTKQITNEQVAINSLKSKKKRNRMITIMLHDLKHLLNFTYVTNTPALSMNQLLNIT